MICKRVKIIRLYSTKDVPQVTTSEQHLTHGQHILCLMYFVSSKDKVRRADKSAMFSPKMQSYGEASQLWKIDPKTGPRPKLVADRTCLHHWNGSDTSGKNAQKGVNQTGMSLRCQQNTSWQEWQDRKMYLTLCTTTSPLQIRRTIFDIAVSTTIITIRQLGSNHWVAAQG